MGKKTPEFLCPHCGAEYKRKPKEDFCAVCLRYFDFKYKHHPFRPMIYDYTEVEPEVNKKIWQRFLEEIKEKFSAISRAFAENMAKILSKRALKPHPDKKIEVFDEKVLLLGEKIDGMDKIKVD